jgi:hypothetical protein
MTISTIVNTREKSTKPATSRMTSQRFHKRSRRRHSARASFIGAQLTAATKRGPTPRAERLALDHAPPTPREQHKVGVKPDTLQTARGAATVKAAPS